MQNKSDTQTFDLFEDSSNEDPIAIQLAQGAVVLRHYALSSAESILQEVHAILDQAPLKKMYTPSGLPMSVLSSSCGSYGWRSDQQGYRYTHQDLDENKPWPSIPDKLMHLAQGAALAAGYSDFIPDSCLINCYQTGAKLSLHQDKDEHDFNQPIVSVSLGLSAIFLFGGLKRNTRPLRYRLDHGDVVVWGGPSRLAFHGIEPLIAGKHPLTGEVRFNLTFRKVY